MPSALRLLDSLLDKIKVLKEENKVLKTELNKLRNIPSNKKVKKVNQQDTLF